MDHKALCAFPFEQSKLKLGSGGSGHVFLGRSIADPSHLVAIKKRFIKARCADAGHHPEDEAEHVVMENCCSHPNTMTLLGSVTCKDTTHFAMELMASDFGVELKKGLVLSLRQTAFVMHELLQAVAHLHALGLVHRDVKPSNILAQLHASSAAGICVVLGDFGVAHYVTEASRPSINFRGTRVFHAPEVLLGRVRLDDARAIDMWAVGCCLYQFLCGRQLVAGESALEVLSKVYELLGTDFASYPRQTRTMRLFDELPTTIPPSAVDLLRGLLQLDPKVRISAADALTHSFFAEFGQALDAPIMLRGYERIDASKYVFKPVAAHELDVADGQPGEKENASSSGRHDRDASCNSSNSSSIHLSQQRAHHAHLTLSNLRTNALFNSCGPAQRQYASSQRVLFGSPQAGLSAVSRMPQQQAAAAGLPSHCSPSPARRTLNFDSPIRAVDLNDAAIEEQW